MGVRCSISGEPPGSLCSLIFNKPTPPYFSRQVKLLRLPAVNNNAIRPRAPWSYYAPLHLVSEFLKGQVNFVRDAPVESRDFRSGRFRVHELSVHHFLNHGSALYVRVPLRAPHAPLDGRPGHFRFHGGVLDGPLAVVVKGDDGAQHADGLGERAREVVVGERVLLEEVFPDDFRHFHHHFLVFGQGLFPHQLHDFAQGIFELQNFTGGVPEHAVLLLDPVEVRLEDPHVLGVGNQPVQGREVLALRELLVQAPKHLHDAQSSRGHRVAEVAPRRGHCPHHRHGALALRGPQALHPPRALVERRQPRAQVSGVPAVRRHFSQAAGNFAEGFGPARRGVGHHRHVQAHVAVVLRQSNPRVNAGFPGRHRHVGRVGHQRGALHDPHFFPVDVDGELREVAQHFGHFVAALAAAHVHDAVRVGKLGQGLGNHRFAAPEGPGHGASAPKHRRKERVYHPETGSQRHVAGEFFGGGAGHPDRPKVGHGQVVGLARHVVAHFEHLLLSGGDERNIKAGLKGRNTREKQIGPEKLGAKCSF